MKTKLLPLLATAFLVGSSVLSVSGQETLRTINDGRNNFRNAPITITGRDVKGKSFNGRQDLAGTDWLEDLTLTVKNVSSKNVKSISIFLTIPQQGSMETVWGFYYPFPQGDVIRTEKGNLDFGKPILLILEPGATVKLRAWQQLKVLDLLKVQGVTDIAVVEIGIRDVTFEDGTGWLGGLPAVEDPSRPGSLIIVNPAGLQSRQSSWWDSNWLSFMPTVTFGPASSPNSNSGFNFVHLRPGGEARTLENPCGYSAGAVDTDCPGCATGCTGVKNGVRPA